MAWTEEFREWVTKRDSDLQTLGFTDYAEYLSSDLWYWIKSRLDLEEKVDQCFVCGSTSGLNWHHSSYSIPVLVGNFSNVPRCVFRLCCDCHRNIHADGSLWLGPEDVRLRLNELCKSYRKSTFFDRDFCLNSWHHGWEQAKGETSDTEV